jgi:protein-tyrosine kinase
MRLGGKRMSRIEKALEKAVKLREASAPVAPGIGVDSAEGNITKFAFEVGEPLVNPSLVNKHIVFIANPHSVAAEQYRKLRARVFRVTVKDNLNTLMIASADSGEGKTITAINLAVAIAQELDRTVLLVDGDLRNPSVHKYLGIEVRHGLSDYLMNKATIPDILVKTGIGRLVLLPAGSAVENPAELLASERMKGLVREMKHRYPDRYLIFDSSPVLLAADALSLGNYMDGIVFVVQADRTSPKVATSALALLKGYNILGSVFNNVPSYLGLRQYPYYYRYGGKYQTGSSRKQDGGNNGSGAKTEL